MYELYIYTGYWTCGGGCCSDSWSELTLTDPNGVAICTDYELRGYHLDYNEPQDFLDHLNERFCLSLSLDNCKIV